VAKPCSVLIGAADLLPKLQERVNDGQTELLSFTDADALRALDAITKRRPRLIALERQFAATPRGAALINRIKADPALAQSEVRIVAHDSDVARVSPRRQPETQDPAGAASAATAVAAPAPIATQPLDQRGTRRAPRFRMAPELEVLVDGHQAVLVDLSTIGAQVVSPNVLKPNQRIRMSLLDPDGAIRFNATVAWASFEIPPKSGPRYRAGIEFIDASGDAVESYCSRNKAS
jgi:hypothetical protein